MALISLQDVTIGFGCPLLIEHEILFLRDSEMACLLGRNGAGKSTLLKLINGDLMPDSGEIVRQKGLRTAYLSQEIPKKINGTVSDILSNEFENLPSSERKGRHQINKIISQMQLDAHAEFNTLSSGIKRKVLLARELV